MASPDVQFSLFAQSIDPLNSFQERMQASTAIRGNYLSEALAAPTAGVCRHCRCNGDSCKLPSGDKCQWSDSTRTCCTAAGCLTHEARSKAPTPKPAKPMTRREARVPCDCASCSGRARGRCRRIYYRP